MKYIDDLDDNNLVFVRNDGSTNFFPEHGLGIGDREKTLEELKALVPDKKRALAEEEERRINAGQESIMDEEPRQGKYRDTAAAFLPTGRLPTLSARTSPPRGIVNDFYSDLAHERARKYGK